METKFCTKCKLEKDIVEFRKRGRDKYGNTTYHSACKVHEQEYNKKYYSSHRDEKQKYYQINKEKIKANSNNERRRTYKRQWQEKNRETISLYNKQYQNQNRASINRRKKSYNKSYREMKYDSDARYRLRRALSTAFYLFLKKINKSKNNSFESYLIYDVNTYMLQIESTFEDWMSWENRDRWHIDHIISVASFDIPDDRHVIVQILWHPLNLRALEARKNTSEGCREVDLDLLKNIIADIELRCNTTINIDTILKLRNKPHV